MLLIQHTSLSECACVGVLTGSHSGAMTDE